MSQEQSFDKMDPRTKAWILFGISIPGVLLPVVSIVIGIWSGVLLGRTEDRGIRKILIWTLVISIIGFINSTLLIFFIS